MRYILKGLDCPHCASSIEYKLRSEYGVEGASVTFATQSLQIDSQHKETVEQVLDEVDPEVELVPAPTIAGGAVGQESAAAGTGFSNELLRIIAAAVIFSAALLLRPVLKQTPSGWADYAVFLTAYSLVGWKVIQRTIDNVLKQTDIFDENFLMTIATFGAIALGELPEAVGVMLFYCVGEYLQQSAVHRSRRSVRSLMQLRPDYARLQISPDQVEKVHPHEVDVGDTIVVQPGDRVPVDGEVQEGHSWVDTSALTGESVPREINPGEEILSGMVNESGVLKVRVKKIYSESQVSRIMQLVEEAANRKAPTEKFITRLARYYTPAVVFGALTLALIPPVVTGTPFSPWIYRALTLLVISCPCALVISIPMGYFGGIGLASKHGILVKGANFLDAMNQVSSIVFDKTGTLTDADFAVQNIHPEAEYTESDVIELAAAAETHSTHPLADAIRRAQRKISSEGEEALTDKLHSYEEKGGRGISARLGQQQVLVGNRRLMQQEGISIPTTPNMGTEVFVARNDHLVGRLNISDAPREDVVSTLSELRKEGINRLNMLTGDTESAAEQVAEQLNIDEFWAELLPEQKVEITEEIKSKQQEKNVGASRVAFVGDGINDAPVIAAADVGIAMGGLGSDAAIEAADVVIMQDQISRLPAAFKIANITRRIVLQNVVMTLGLKATFLGLGALGLTTMWGAVFADVGVALLAVLNSARILTYQFD